MHVWTACGSVDLMVVDCLDKSAADIREVVGNVLR